MTDRHLRTADPRASRQTGLAPLLGPIETVSLALMAVGLATGHAAELAPLALWLVCPWVAARGLVAWLYRGLPSDPGTRILATAVLAYAVVVTGTLSLGVVGALVPGIAWGLWLTAAVGGLVLIVRYPERPPAEGPDHSAPSPVSCVAATLLLGLTAARVAAEAELFWSLPPGKWDALSYHLYFPVRWLHAGQLHYVPKPFGPEFITYFPANFELWVAWSYGPALQEWLPRAAGLPFLVWCMVALWHWSRRMGCGPAGAALAPTGLTLSLAVLNGVEPANDIPGAACFLTALFFACDAASGAPQAGSPWDRQRLDQRSLLLAGLATGLFAGTKYPNLVFLPLLVVPVLIYAGRTRPVDDDGRFDVRAGHVARRLVAWAAAVCLGGGFWYVRNLLAAGNPLYPAHVELFGLTLFDGPVTRESMLLGGWTHEGAGWAGLWSALQETVDARWLAACGVAALLLVVVRGRTSTLRAWLTLLVPPAGLLLFWYLIPYNTQLRYAWGPLLLAWCWPRLVASRLDGESRWRQWLRDGWLTAMITAMLVGLLWPEVEAAFELRAAFPASWTVASLESLVGWNPALSRDAWLLGGLSLMWLTTAAWVSRIGATLGVVVGSVVLVTVGPLSPAVDLWLDPAAVRARAPEVGTVWDVEVGFGWREVDRLSRRADYRIAYAGHNHPYRLFGPDLTNRVRYVATHAHADWLLDDHPELRVVRDRVPGYRDPLDRDAWFWNLREQRIDLLFVTAVHPNERFAFEDELDAQGFGVERRWSDELGFPLLYTSPGGVVRLYGVPQ